MGYREIGQDEYVHVYNRGVKKMPIYRDVSDLWRLRSLLFYLNHAQPMPNHWTQELEQMHDLVWPESWNPRVPIVSVLAYALRPNHLHLFLKEATDGGIAKFMHRVSMAYSKYINRKHGESGRLFEGTYKSRLIVDEEDFKNLGVYIMVKNPFGSYPGGLSHACSEFDAAYEQALRDPFSSLCHYENSGTESPILDRELLGGLFSEPGSFKEFARERIQSQLDRLSEYDF